MPLAAPAGVSFRLLLVTDRRRQPQLVAAVERALSLVPPGGVAVQLREKDLDARQLAELARALVPVCEARHAPLLINDRLDLAARLRVGVHLPAASWPAAAARAFLGPQALVGCSCHSAAEVHAARDGGASFATFGPIFETASKRPFGQPVGLEALRAAARLGLPLLALGGIHAGNTREAIAAGACGASAISAVFAAADPAAAALALWTEVEAGLRTPQTGWGA